MCLAGFSLNRHVCWVKSIRSKQRPDLMLNRANRQRSDWKCQYQTIADYEQWCKCLFSPGKSCWLTPLFTLWPEDLPDRNLSYLSKKHNSWHLLTPKLMRSTRNTISYVILTFHSAEKCYWDRRWHVAAPRSQTRLKHKRWAPLFSAAWLYKSCLAPKTKVEAKTGVILLYTSIKHTHTHTLPCLQ